VTAAEDHTARVWDPDGRERGILAGHSGTVTWASFSRDGTSIVTASDDRDARVWRHVDVDSSPPGLRLGPAIEGLVFAGFLADGRRVVTACVDGTYSIWDVEADHVISSPPVRLGAALSAARLSRDRTRLAAALDDGTIGVWPLDGSPPIRTQVPPSRFSSLAWSPGDLEIVSTAHDGYVRLWRVGEAQARTLTPSPYPYEPWDAEFSPDGTLLAIASDSDIAEVVDLSGHTVARLVGHRATISSAVFSHDGRKILTASTDHTARVWPFSAEDVLRETRSHVFPPFTADEGKRGGRLLPPGD
jgi:WD40 repeat protein